MLKPTKPVTERQFLALREKAANTGPQVSTSGYCGQVIQLVKNLIFVEAARLQGQKWPTDTTSRQGQPNQPVPDVGLGFHIRVGFGYVD